LPGAAGRRHLVRGDRKLGAFCRAQRVAVIEFSADTMRSDQVMSV
jgi:hypothetical protein